MNLSFDNDTTEVKKFIDTIPEKVDHRKEKLSEGIRTFDAKLRELAEQGLDEITTLKLCRLFTEFKNTGRNLSLRFTSRDVHYSLDEDVDAIGKEWEEKYEASKDKLEEAEKDASEESAAETEAFSGQEEPLPLKEEEEPAPEPAPLRFATSKTVKKTLAEEEAKQREEEQKTKLLNLQKETEQRIQEQLAEEKAEEQKEKDKKKLFLIIALVLVLLCALAAGYYYMQNYLALENGETEVMRNSQAEYAVAVLTEDSPEMF